MPVRRGRQSLSPVTESAVAPRVRSHGLTESVVAFLTMQNYDPTWGGVRGFAWFFSPFSYITFGKGLIHSSPCKTTIPRGRGSWLCMVLLYLGSHRRDAQRLPAIGEFVVWAEAREECALLVGPLCSSALEAWGII